jgi:hypothetical protein
MRQWRHYLLAELRRFSCAFAAMSQAFVEQCVHFERRARAGQRRRPLDLGEIEDVVYQRQQVIA